MKILLLILTVVSILAQENTLSDYDQRVLKKQKFLFLHLDSLVNLYDEYYRAFYDFNEREKTYDNARLVDPPILPAFDIWAMCTSNSQYCDVELFKLNGKRNLFRIMGFLTSMAEAAKTLVNHGQRLRNESEQKYIALFQSFGYDLGSLLRVALNYRTPV